jgi:serine/threonine protein kinase
MFSNEIAILAACDHRNITKFITSYFHEEELWILLEVCGGWCSAV